MTELGEYLKRKSINKADVSRKTGISSARLSELSRKEKTNLKAEELYLIACAIDVSPVEILESIYSHLTLKNQ